MDKVKNVLSSKGASVIYFYIVTLIIAILAYSITMQKEPDIKTNSYILNELFNIFKSPIYLVWFGVLFCLFISLVVTISWIREKIRKRNK
jgi:Na+/H+ antiporter NhaC